MFTPGKVHLITLALIAWFGSLSPAGYAADIGTAFTYQGYLEKPAGTPVTATCAFEFSLWDAPGSGSPPTGGTQIGTTQRVIITDGDDCTNFEWQFGKGITFK